MKQRAAFHGLLVKDSKEFGKAKAKDFAAYKAGYFKATETENIIPQKMFRDKENNTETKEQKKSDLDAVSKSIYGMPNKVKSMLYDTTMEFGYDGSACDIENKIIQVGIGATKEEIDHEIGHLVEEYMIDKNVVDDYKKSLTKGLSMRDIIVKQYKNTSGQSIDIFVIDNDVFETEYQSRLYVDYMDDAINDDGTIKIECMLECISESFRKYMNGENIDDNIKKIIEGAIL